jgi:hypothetical protein
MNGGATQLDIQAAYMRVSVRLISFKAN